MKKMIDCPLFDNPVEMTQALMAVASQAPDNEWGWPSEIPEPRYDQTLMMAAANYIRTLETQVEALQQAIELYCEGEMIPESIVGQCTQHATMLNYKLAKRLVEMSRGSVRESLPVRDCHEMD